MLRTSKHSSRSPLTAHRSPDSNRETKCCGPPSTAGAHLALTEKLNAADIQALNAADLQALNAADLQAQQPLTSHCSLLTSHLTVIEKLNAADLQAQQPLTAHCSLLTAHLTVTEKLNAADPRPTSSTAKPPVLQAEAGLGLTA